MTEMTAGEAGIETRQAMFRVWMAISAVWVAFWLSIAGILIGVTGNTAALLERMSLFSLIILTPPVVLLSLGAVFRLVQETFSRRPRRISHSPRRVS